MAPIQSKVYRLRGIPEHLDRLDVTQLIGTERCQRSICRSQLPTMGRYTLQSGYFVI